MGHGMNQDEQDRIYGRAVREEREATRHLACVKAKAAELAAKSNRITGNFVHDVLEKTIDEASWNEMPDSQDLRDVARELREADETLAEKIRRMRDLDQSG